MEKLKFGPEDDVIFTTYFTGKQNPQADQRGQYAFVPVDQISYIFPWYVSVSHLKLNAVVIHDELSCEFVNAHETENLQFVKYHLGAYSLNDERYFALDDILSENKLNRVLLTDGSDLLIKKNPFEMLTDPEKMYFGSDVSEAPKVRDNAWCLKKAMNLISAGKGYLAVDESFLDFEYINAGVYGGHYQTVKEFTKGLRMLFDLIDDEKNNNMMAINYLLWKHKIKHFKGQPLTSQFKRYELHGDYYIIHK